MTTFLLVTALMTSLMLYQLLILEFIIIIIGVPTLVMVGPDGEIISYDANVDVSKDPEGKV